MKLVVAIPEDSSEAVRETLRRLTTELGNTFSLEGLYGYIQRWRGKRLRVEEDTMDPGMTGYAIALKDCDLIATRRGLTKTQKKVTQLHEIAHFVKGDMPLFSHEEKTSDYKTFIKKRDRHAAVTSRQRFFDTYNDEIEHDAEELARILAQIVTVHAKHNSHILSDLLGR